MRFRLLKNRGFSTLAWGTSLFKIGGSPPAFLGGGWINFNLRKTCSWAKKVGWKKKRTFLECLFRCAYLFFLILFLCQTLQFLLNKHSLVWNSLVLRDLFHNQKNVAGGCAASLSDEHSWEAWITQAPTRKRGGFTLKMYPLFTGMLTSSPWYNIKPPIRVDASEIRRWKTKLGWC